ncbi:unnamed protein product [Blepharisma stoltei]|uniref:Protein-tyrosine-phosphatase n=1 Tax=Blepharisma stoltei TaxID=1481888 RepID=A0AAU9J0L4_9CILI|nr:unnamed protein product [Blepharisma stoltei]
MVIKRKRNDVPDQVIKKLYLGSLAAANNHTILYRLGITHVLTVCPIRPSKVPNVTYYLVSISDDPTVNILSKLDECFEFINAAINNGGKVLVHCFQGVSRSATVVIAYLMKFHNMRYSDAFEHVRHTREIIDPNFGFRRQLEEFEGMVFSDKIAAAV